eukprot:gnl/Hemi2/27054_TR9091_c0_g1_i1.p1 gnl/Hemi2/27054_TR9091_c0_g1~~gnl/Hemi2/27054_TR9091_c0_g1_i1.p1  ORF type:complete len:1108 (-),score=253.86 gnl/Hemi2/27054_TR9091_c0_g1_i1:234-3557(-)
MSAAAMEGGTNVTVDKIMENISIHLAEDDKPSEITLNITGMSCGNCSGKIRQALLKVDGVVAAEVSHVTKKAVVQVRGGGPTAEALADVARNAGRPGQFTVTLPTPPPPPAQQEIFLRVTGMSCGKCAGRITQALQKTEGVAECSVSHVEKQARVVSTLTAEQLTDIIQAAGRPGQFVVSLPNAVTPTADVPVAPVSDDLGDSFERHLSSSLSVERLRALKSVTAPTLPHVTSQTTEPWNEELPLLTEVPIGEMPDFDTMEVVCFRIQGMTCASCVASIEGPLRTRDGIYSISVALIEERATIKYNPNVLIPAQIRSLIEGCGGFKATQIDHALKNTVLRLRVTPALDEAKIGAWRREAMLPGVRGLDLMDEEDGGLVRLEYDPHLVGIRKILAAFEEHGIHVAIDGQARDEKSNTRKLQVEEARVTFLYSCVFTAPIAIIMFLMLVPALNNFLMLPLIDSWSLPISDAVVFVLTTPVLMWFGRGFVFNAYKALSHCHANMDVLVALSTHMAYWYSVLIVILRANDPKFQGTVFFETSAFLITFILLGRYLEKLAKGKTMDSIEKLASLAPPEAILLEEQSERVIPAELIEIGDLLKVVAGGKVPTDGIVESGKSSVDESMLTGESKAVKKRRGDPVTGGTINGNGVLCFRATKVGSETVLSQIIQLVADAQTAKAPVERMADRISSFFVPVVVLIAVGDFIIWYWLAETNALPPSYVPASMGNFLFSFLFATSVLVIACPCALGLATPTAVMVATGVGAKQGILIKGGEALEAAKNCTALVFDKTGTLTESSGHVADFRLFSSTLTEREALRLAGIAESGSDHPLAVSIKKYAAEKTNASFVDGPSDFNTTPGKGIECRIDDTVVRLGNTDWMGENVWLIEEVLHQAVEAHTQALAAAGLTSVWMSVGGKLTACFGLAHEIKPKARQVVKRLMELGLDVWMVTGDNRDAADKVARKVGIDNVHCQALPQHKVQRIRDLQMRGHVVAMVGDGINDAPALKAADVGIAIGAGTQVAIDQAKIVLVNSALEDVLVALDLSRTAFNRIRLNYLWAFGYNVLGIPIAAGAFFPFVHSHLPPVVASICMVFSSLSVITSSLLLSWYKRPTLS